MKIATTLIALAAIKSAMLLTPFAAVAGEGEADDTIDHCKA